MSTINLINSYFFSNKRHRSASFFEFPKLFRFSSLIVEIKFKIPSTASIIYLTLRHGEGEGLTINRKTFPCLLVFHLVSSGKEIKILRGS